MRFTELEPCSKETSANASLTAYVGAEGTPLASQCYRVVMILLWLKTKRAG